MKKTPVTVITGANRGLGFATARALAERGHRVVLTARDQGKADEAAEVIRREVGEGAEVHAMVLDVASDESVAAFVGRVAEAVGPVDVLINNAGAFFDAPGAPSLANDAATIMTSLDTNTVGAWRLIRALLPGMNDRGFGRVVNVSSGLGGLSDMGSGTPGYRISKAALNAVTIVSAHEAGDGVKVNSVCPGWVRTDMGGPNATRAIDEGIAGIVWAATLGADGPSGGFFRDGKPVDW